MKNLNWIFIFMVLSGPLMSQDTSLLDTGYAHYENGDYDKALLVLEKAAIQSPDNPEVFYLMGVCQSLSEDNYSALKSFARAIELDPGYAEAYYETGYAHFLMGKLEKSLEAFDKAIQLRPNYAEAYVNRGSLKCMLEDPEGAKKDWDKAADLGAALPVRECN
jgi:tetratricopeptide (TPR) repeat protein